MSSRCWTTLLREWLACPEPSDAHVSVEKAITRKPSEFPRHKEAKSWAQRASRRPPAAGEPPQSSCCRQRGLGVQRIIFKCNMPRESHKPRPQTARIAGFSIPASSQHVCSHHIASNPMTQAAQPGLNWAQGKAGMCLQLWQHMDRTHRSLGCGRLLSAKSSQLLDNPCQAACERRPGVSAPYIVQSSHTYN